MQVCDGNRLSMSAELRNLTTFGWFAQVDPAAQQEVLACMSVRRAEPGEALYRQGDPADCLFVVLDGCIRVSSTDAAGREAILSFYETGSWLGETGVLSGTGRCDRNGIVERAALLAILPASDLLRLLDRHPSLTKALLFMEARRLAVMLNAFGAWMTHSVPQKIAHRLLMMLDLHGEAVADGERITVDASQETLAGLVGATRQRVGQVMTAWARAGMITVRRGRIVVHDRAALAALLPDRTRTIPISLAQTPAREAAQAGRAGRRSPASRGGTGA